MAAKKKTQPRKVPRQARSQNTVDVIVEAATRILTTEGFEGANVNRIAELAGVSVGSLYQYFPSKEAVVGAVAKRLGEQTASLVSTRMAALEGLPLRGAIAGIVACVLDAYRLNPPLRRIIRQDVPEVVPFFETRDIDAQLRERIRDYLLAHRPSIRPPDLDLALRMMFVAIEAISEATTDLPQETVQEELVCMLERYLLVDAEETG